MAAAGAAEGDAPISSKGIGSVWTFGKGEIKALGHGDTTTLHAPKRVSLKGNVISVRCGGNFTAALMDDGSVYTWGTGAHGRLGHGSEEDSLFPKKVAGAISSEHVVAIATGDWHMLALTKSGRFFAWGNNSHGELGVGSTVSSTLPVEIPALSGRGILSFDAGRAFSAAVLNTGELFTWGACVNGRLDNGETVGHVTVPTQVAKLKDEQIVFAGCGL
eukprot:EC726782.1.p1 GENE.EC726782.1~~EC726782.1.p1  ORF type:complete len:218 (+),score=8.51 EC726782.1:33-686(+)